MSSLVSEQTLLTTPDPSNVQPKISKIIAPEGDFITLTTGSLTTDTISIGGNQNQYSGTVTTTTDATPTILNTVTTTSNRSSCFNVKVVAMSAAGDSAVFTATIKAKNNSGTLTIGPPINNLSDKDTSLLPAGITYTVSSQDFNVVGTGVAATTIKWTAFIDEVYVSL